MNISQLEQTRIAIWGLGAEGWASYRYIRTLFPHKKIILINQLVPDEMPDDPDCEFLLESDLPNHLSDFDTVIKSPGISLYLPQVKDLKAKGITVTSATNIWFAQPRTAKVIAITGSNGKSTTSALLAHTLTKMGLKAELGGNIGKPLLSLPEEADYYIIELSSYQTADLQYAPDIAVLLNLFPEHIQWHQNHKQYYSDKCHLIETGAKSVILNRTNILTLEQITSPPKNVIWFNDPLALHADEKYIYFGDKILGYARDLKLPGAHNRENLCAVLTVCQLLDLNIEECFAQAISYTGLPHRLENLGQAGDHFYINDSISTTPEATLAALNSFKGRAITLIAGGQNRQQDFTVLARYCADHPEVKVITAYETAPQIVQALAKVNLAPAAQVKNLTEAVNTAIKITPKMGIILLSPAAPSYDGFKNFEHRGQQFKDLIPKE